MVDLEKNRKYFSQFTKTSKYHERITTEESERRAELTSSIDYGCSFVDGICFIHRHQNTNERCCCTGCANSHGYIDSYIQISIEGAEVRSELFDSKDGFWRKGKGCILPRKYRSRTCLRHSCAPNPELTKQINELILNGNEYIPSAEVAVSLRQHEIAGVSGKCPKCHSGYLDIDNYASSNKVQVVCRNCKVNLTITFEVTTKITSIKKSTKKK